MPITPCPECKSFMTDFNDYYQCKRCGYAEDKKKKSTSSKVITDETPTIITFKNQYLELMNEIKYNMGEIIKKINLLHSTLGIKKLEHFDKVKIDEIKINEKTFQISMMHNVNEFIRVINNSCESLFALVNDITNDLQLEVNANVTFTYSSSALEYLVSTLYQELYHNKDDLICVLENETTEQGLLGNKKSELEEIRLHLSNTLNTLNKFI